MSPRTGRPTNNPRNISLNLRISQKEADHAPRVRRKVKYRKDSEIARGIEMVKAELEKK